MPNCPHRPWSVVLLTTLLLAGCGKSATEAPAEDEVERLEPDAFCANNAPESVATFEDTNLEAEVRLALAIGSGPDLTCAQLATLTGLVANDAGIVSLVGIQNLPGITDLNLSGNQILDIARLTFLAGLSTLDLSDNPGLADFEPLLNHTGIGQGDVLDLTATAISCEDVAELEARGVIVTADCTVWAQFPATLQPGGWHGFILERSDEQPTGFPDGAHDRTRLNRSYVLATPTGFTRWGENNPTAPGQVSENIHAFQAEYNGSVWSDVLRLHAAFDGPVLDVLVKVYAQTP